MNSSSLDYKKTFLLGFGFLGVSVIWTLYNAYVPVLLHARRDARRGARGDEAVAQRLNGRGRRLREIA
jgi:hypothetical protein